MTPLAALFAALAFAPAPRSRGRQALLHPRTACVTCGAFVLEEDEPVSFDREPQRQLFGDLPVPEAMAAALREAGIEKPTKIQAISGMEIHRGAHTLLHSETGSGKTFAYLLPLLASLHVSKPNQLLVV